MLRQYKTQVQNLCDGFADDEDSDVSDDDKDSDVSDNDNDSDKEE